MELSFRVYLLFELSSYVGEKNQTEDSPEVWDIEMDEFVNE